MDPNTVAATFEIDNVEEDLYDEFEAGPKLSRVTVSKTYRGPIDGKGVAHVLTAQGSAGGGYVASERVVGAIEGRSGSFVIQHHGLADGRDQRASGEIVPGSGTGELAKISGEAFEASEGILTLKYRL